MVRIISVRDLGGTEDHYDLTIDGVVYEHNSSDQPRPKQLMTEVQPAPIVPVQRVYGKPMEVVKHL